jgi:hypothetical protein
MGMPAKTQHACTSAISNVQAFSFFHAKGAKFAQRKRRLHQQLRHYQVFHAAFYKEVQLVRLAGYCEICVNFSKKSTLREGYGKLELFLLKFFQQSPIESSNPAI